ncbi:MAG: phosphatidylserine decarboxylase [Lentisphaerota bacterium]
MKLNLVKDGLSPILGGLILFCMAGWFCRFMGWDKPAYAVCAVGTIYVLFMLYFFRDPDRVSTARSNEFVAGADGLIRAVEIVNEKQWLKTETVRISVFLNPFDVHVNRSPMGGKVTGLQYTPGLHVLTMNNRASDVNEHSSILIEGEKTRCLVKQIVGPIVRRVVYWLQLNQSIASGERIGMMKFGSRLDMYFPKDDVKVVVKKGDRVKAGITVVAVLAKEK